MMKRKTFTAAILAAAMIFGGAATGGAALAANSYVNICATAEEGAWTPSVVGGSLDERVPSERETATGAMRKSSGQNS